MSQQDTLDALKRIKKFHENSMIVIGITIGVILIGYFFTFAMLVDRGMTAAVWFQTITTVLMALMLAFIRRVGFFVTGLLLAGDRRCRPLLKAMTVSDLGRSEQELLEKFG